MKPPVELEPHPTETRNPKTQPGRYPELDLDDKTHRKSHWWIWLLIFGVIGYGCYRLYNFETSKKQALAAKRGAMRPHRMSVTAASAHRGDMPVYLEGLGTVTAFNTVTVKTRIDGQLVSVNFREGQSVRQGDSLAGIDPRPY